MEKKTLLFPKNRNHLQPLLHKAVRETCLCSGRPQPRNPLTRHTPPTQRPSRRPVSKFLPSGICIKWIKDKKVTEILFRVYNRSPFTTQSCGIGSAGYLAVRCAYKSGMLDCYLTCSLLLDFTVAASCFMSKQQFFVVIWTFDQPMFHELCHFCCCC